MVLSYRCMIIDICPPTVFIGYQDGPILDLLGGQRMS